MATERYLLGEMSRPELDDFEEHMFGHVIRVRIKTFFRFVGVYSDPGCGICGCNRQENLAIMAILGCLIRGSLTVCRAERVAGELQFCQPQRPMSHCYSSNRLINAT